MVGTLAQMITLVSYGNDFFATKTKTEKLTHNSTFQFCRFVTYKVKTENKTIFGTNELIFGDPYDWFGHLKEDGCKKLCLVYKRTENKNGMADYMTAGFIGGGGQWFIKAVYTDKALLWACRWVLNKFGAQDSRIWEVTYMNIDTVDITINPDVDLDACKRSLLKSVEGIEKFAVRTERGTWANRFKEAIGELGSDEPHIDYYTDLIIEKNYSIAARQLLACAQKVWVFGGMGWWNDFIYKDEDDQQLNINLSSELYYNICNSIVLATNSHQPPQ